MDDAGFAWSLVAGGSGGIGAAVARELARRRKALVLVGRDSDRLAAVVDDCLALGASVVKVLAVDIRDRIAIEHHIATLMSEAPIESLIVCAGVLEGRCDGEVVEGRDPARVVLEVNLLATVDLVYLVLPHMIDRAHGTIVLVSSLAAMVPLPDAPSYSASKAGLLFFGSALRESLRGRGIRVSTVCPGYVETPMTERHMGPQPGRLAAEDVAEAILRCLKSNREMVALPFFIGWLARFSLMVPPRIRALIMGPLRFYVARREHPHHMVVAGVGGDTEGKSTNSTF